MDGFIKIYRSILDWEWWDDANTTRVFLWLLLNAQWEDSRYRGYDIPRGSLVTSYPSIAKNLNISVKSARVALNHLKTTGEVAVKGQAHFSIVTIVNWEKFQGFDFEEGSHLGSHLGRQGAGKGQTKGIIKEYNNIINKEYKNNIFTPPTLDEVRAYCLERKNKVDADAFINFYESKGWMVGKNKMKDWKAAVRTWERNRKEESKSSVDIYRQYKHNNYDFEALERDIRNG